MNQKRSYLYSFLLTAGLLLAVFAVPQRARAQACLPTDCPIYQTLVRYYDRWIPYTVYQYYDVPVYYDVVQYVDRVVTRVNYYDDPTLCPTPVPCPTCPACQPSCPNCVCSSTGP